jgi:cytochrome c peroxidase
MFPTHPHHPETSCLRRRSRAGTGANLLVLVAAAVMAATASPVTAQQPQQSAAPDINDLKAAYRRQPPRPVENNELVDVGRLLFWDPRLSHSGKTACVTCHLPYLGWATTDSRSLGDSGRPTSRKSQSLLGIGHAEGIPVGWDGRNPTLEAQAKSSISTGSMSMRGTDKAVKVEVIEERIRAIPPYTKPQIE